MLPSSPRRSSLPLVFVTVALSAAAFALPVSIAARTQTTGRASTAAAASAKPHTIELPFEALAYQKSDLPGYQFTIQQCSICHSPEYVLYQPRTSPRAYWQATVDKMVKVFGAPLPADQVAPIVDYLTRTYGAEAPAPKAAAAASPQSAATATRTTDEGRLVTALAIHTGSIVAEIGAGGGAMTVAMAKEVGESGRVFTTELGDDHVSTLRKAIDAAHATNITVVEGDPNKTNLPDQCCDALFMQRVYHHFLDPAAMNGSILRSLKPGGRLAVMDFPPDDGKSAAPKDRASSGHHGVTAATVKSELEAAGFEAVTIEPHGNSGDRNGFLVTAKKPSAQ